MAKRKYQNPATQEQAKKNPAGAPPSIVLHEIDVRPFGRREQDIPSWRNALRSAESIIPRRTLLYDLYADVDLDGHVEAVTGKRRDAVTTANWQFVDKEGSPIDAVNELIDSIGFDDMLKEIMNSKFWGYSILEPTFFRSDDGTWEMEPNLIPRLNYRPEKGIVAKDYSTDEGINIREGIYARTVMEVGNPKDLGLYLKAAPYQILKRGGLGDWALFVQVFGNPIVDATWDGFDEKQRKQLLDAVAALGSGGAIVRPEGTNINLLENKTNANGDLQDKFMSFLNREISKALLGSTETTESSTSSGYAQAETHAGQDERKNESDINFTRRVLNSRFIKILNAAGFDTQGGRFIVEGEDNELSIKDSFDIQMKLKEKGLPMDDDFFYETYGIPKPENYDQIKKDQEAAAKADSVPERSRRERSRSQPPPEPVEGEETQNLLSRLRSFFLSAPATVPERSRGTGACGEPRIELSAVQADPPFKKLLNSVQKAEGKAFIYPEIAWHNMRVLTDGFQRGWKSDELIQLADIGIRYGTTDPRMQTAWEMNLFKFSTVKAAYQSREVNELFRRSPDFAAFERAVRKTYGTKYKPWLQTEYNTAYQTAEAAATYFRLKEQTNTFPYWEYRTIGDDRVRDSHRTLHGIILPADHPLWRKIFPPNGWGCRCYVVPRLKGEVNPDIIAENIAFVQSYIETDPEWVKARKDGFASNKADSLAVFNDSQSYASRPGEVERRATGLLASHWGLDPARDIQQRTDRTYTAQTEAALDELWQTFRESNEQALLSDYRKRPLSLSRQTLDQAAGSDSYRITAQLPDIISQPDEVWIGGDGRMDTFTYLRYYRNGILLVRARLDSSGDLVITGWQEVQGNPEPSRRGLVIKS